MCIILITTILFQQARVESIHKGTIVSNIRIIRTVKEMSSIGLELSRKNRKTGLVPTMGYLHEGHLSLLSLIKERCDLLMASIFVNPIQFGKDEDIEKYPRDEENDLKLLSAAGCELVFCPSAEDMYPDDFQTYIDVGELTKPLCGRFRPDHFRGVTTVVGRLFNITGCTIAAFGLKDYQQAKVIERMVKDLNLNVDLLFGETVREHDGLALSSRNAYLDEEQRKLASLISKSLEWARFSAAEGEKNCETLLTGMRNILDAGKGINIQYMEAVDPLTLRRCETVVNSVQILVAAYIGNTRLIDNINAGPASKSKPIEGVNV